MIYEPGFIQVDVKYLPQMTDETPRRYLFVASNKVPDCADHTRQDRRQRPEVPARSAPDLPNQSSRY